MKKLPRESANRGLAPDSITSPETTPRQGAIWEQSSSASIFAGQHTRFYLFWGPAGLLEMLFAAGLFGDFFRGGFLIALHAAAGALVFFGMPKKEGRTAAVLVFFLPPLGWLLAGLLHILSVRKIKAVYEEEDIPLDHFLEPPIRPKSAFERKGAVARELDILPYAEIMRGDDSSLKRGAIERLAEIGTPGTIGVLNTYSRDPSPEIRFFVTAALTELKKRFEARLHAEREAMRRNAAAERRRALAAVYLEFARSGLADEKTAGHYEDEAIEHLNAAIRDGGVSGDVYGELLSLYEDRKMWGEALRLLEEPGASQEISPAKRLEKKMRIYFETGRFAEVRETGKELRGRGGLRPPWSGLVDWWTGGDWNSFSKS